MDSRVAALETHIEYARADMAEVKLTLKELTKSVADLTSDVKMLPTKADLSNFKVQWLGITLVAFATIVGSIIGGLDWIKTH